MNNAKRMNKGKIVLIVVGVLLVLGIIGVATTPTAQVPDVSGQSGTEAEQTLKSQGFNTINFQNNDNFSTVANDITFILLLATWICLLRSLLLVGSLLIILIYSPIIP